MTVTCLGIIQENQSIKPLIIQLLLVRSMKKYSITHKQVLATQQPKNARNYPVLLNQWASLHREANKVIMTMVTLLVNFVISTSPTLQLTLLKPHLPSKELTVSIFPHPLPRAQPCLPKSEIILWLSLWLQQPLATTMMINLRAIYLCHSQRTTTS